MDRNFWGWGGIPARGISEEEIAWTPSVEVRQSGNNLVISADLPGLSENDVKLEVTEDGLLIQGERTQEYSENEGGVQRSERSYGRFYRLIPLPGGAKIDEAQANFNNGVLEVTIPTPQSEQKRRPIPISRSHAPKPQHSRAKSADGAYLPLRSEAAVPQSLVWAMPDERFPEWRSSRLFKRDQTQ